MNLGQSSVASSALSLLTSWWEGTTAENEAAAQASMIRSAQYADEYIQEEIDYSLKGLSKTLGENVAMSKKAQSEILLTFGAIGAVAIIGFLLIKK